MQSRQSPFGEQVPGEAGDRRSGHVAQSLHSLRPGWRALGPPLHPLNQRRGAPAGHSEGLLQHLSRTEHEAVAGRRSELIFICPTGGSIYKGRRAPRTRADKPRNLLILGQSWMQIRPRLLPGWMGARRRWESRRCVQSEDRSRTIPDTAHVQLSNPPPAPLAPPPHQLPPPPPHPTHLDVFNVIRVYDIKTRTE